MGGSVDPKTGQMVWTMSVPIADQLAHYRSHPPSALRDLRAMPIESIDWQFDGHGEPVNSIFQLGCRCGSTLFTPTCGLELGEDENTMGPPIWVECAACDAAFEVFDAGAHGWNAVMCGDQDSSPPTVTGDLESQVLVAPHEIIVRFEHGSDDLGNPGPRARRVLVVHAARP
jgi:hypothetical protein